MSRPYARRLGPERGTWGRIAAISCLGALPLAGHVLSVSHGSLRLESGGLRYELRMPLAELPDGGADAASLLGAFGVSAGGQPGKRLDTECREDSGQGLYLCDATYAFATPPKAVTVRCEYHAVTVPHHVHVLNSGAGDLARTTVFDIVSREADIRFTAPTAWEVFATEFGAGIRRALTSPELLLFLAALALVGRSRRESLACAGTFFLAQGSVATVSHGLAWTPAPRFLEAAAALTVAYLAAELLLLPSASKRWLVCAGLGGFHGLFLAGFLLSSQMQPATLLPGALGCEAALLALLGGLRLKASGPRIERLAALLLLLGGLGWFALRLVA